MSQGDDYIIEFTVIGNVMKVTAIDPISGTEVSMVGSPVMSQEFLAKRAVKKLEYVMNKRSGGY